MNALPQAACCQLQPNYDPNLGLDRAAKPDRVDRPEFFVNYASTGQVPAMNFEGRLSELAFSLMGQVVRQSHL